GDAGARGGSRGQADLVRNFPDMVERLARVEPVRPWLLDAPKEFPWLGTVGEEQRPLVNRSVRLAKAKVAGSNPVFRSIPAPESLRISGPWMTRSRPSAD